MYTTRLWQNPVHHPISRLTRPDHTQEQPNMINLLKHDLNTDIPVLVGSKEENDD